MEEVESNVFGMEEASNNNESLDDETSSLDDETRNKLLALPLPKVCNTSLKAHVTNDTFGENRSTHMQEDPDDENDLCTHV